MPNSIIATQSLDRGIQASLDCPGEPDNDRHGDDHEGQKRQLPGDSPNISEEMKFLKEFLLA
jgi:hypothetical protein